MERHRAEFRFYEELNDFLPGNRRKQTIAYVFHGHPGVKDAIEALGVPHSEVDLIVVNGRSVGFDYQLRPGDRVAVYPCFEAFDISPVVKLREAPLRRTAFVLDVHLGKLARLLRLLGFDALYRNDYDDYQVINPAVAEHRIILTRDRGLLFHKVVTHGYYIRSSKAMQQAREVLDRFDLSACVRPFRRCLACNGIIEPVDKQSITHELQPLTRAHYTTFARCGDCRRIYWQGSHYARLAEKLSRLAAGQTPRQEKAGDGLP